jgi:predicted DNA-binding ribbon-helix-helix protein
MALHVRITLRFDEATYEELEVRARRRGVPIAHLVREAVEQHLDRSETSPALRPFRSETADALVGSLAAGVSDESDNHDAYLYGWPREARRTRR